MDDNRIIWLKRSIQSPLLQLLVPKPGREQLFLSYHVSLFGGHLGRNWTFARLAHHFYWSAMSDVKEWLRQCVVCVKWKSPVGRHHPLGNIPTSHHWDRIAMDILDVCDAGRISLHSGDRRLLQQMDGGLPYKEQVC